MNKEEIARLEKIALKLKVKTLEMMKEARGGHVGGSMSIAEIITALYFSEMNINPKDPNDPDRDRFILSKGHACFILYAAFAEIGFLSEDDLKRPYKVDSPIQAHPERGTCPGIDIGTGALGQGLSAGIGMALGAKLRKKNFRVYVVIGDGEAMEGQVWEAAMSASKYKLDNLVAILDYNKLALSGPTEEVMPLEPIVARWQAFSWHVIEVNGHSIPELLDALNQARKKKGKPTMIIAHTVKAKGISWLENVPSCHAISWTLGEANRAISEVLTSEK